MIDFREYVAYQDIASQLKASLLCERKLYTDSISFEIFIMTDKYRNKGDQCHRYKIKQWNKRGEFDILIISLSILHWFNCWTLLGI